MKAYIWKRILQLIPILIGISVLTFLLLYLSPGDPAQKKLAAMETVIEQDVLDEMREEMGLNRPFIEQYMSWAAGILHGDFGTSYKDNTPVAKKLFHALGKTAILAFFAILLTLVIAIPVGIYTAVRHGRAADYLIRFFSFIGNSVPGFLLSVLLMYLFCIRVKWFPVIAKGSIRGLFLPVLALALPRISSFIRQIRAIVLEQLGKDYVHGQRCRGVKERYVLFKNVLHNSMISIITLLGLSIGGLMGGSVVIETIFGWQGIGKLVMDSITARDYPVIQGFVVIMAVIYVTVNLLTDISYRYLDPRVERN